MSQTTAPSAEPTLDLIDSQSTNRQDDPSNEEFLAFSVKYSKSILSLKLSTTDTVSDLKAVLFSLTDVPPQRQKLMGLAKGKLPPDDISIGDIAFPTTSLKALNENGEKKVLIMLIGTPEADTFKDPTGKIKFREVSIQISATDGRGLS